MKKIGLLCAIACACIVFCVSCDSLGEKKEFNGIELYYTSEIRESLADSLGNFLVENGFADGDKKTIQLTKNQNTYELRVVVKKGIEQDQEYIDGAKELGAILSVSLFNKSNVDVHYCDDNLKTLRVIPMASIEGYVSKDEVLHSTSSNYYSIKYPELWESVDDEDAAFMLAAPLESENDKFTENVNLMFEQDITADLNSYFEYNLAQIKELIPSATIHEKSSITQAGYPCYKLHMSFEQEGVNITSIQYYWVQNSRAYVLTFTAETKKYDEYKTVFSNILNSFEILND